MPRSRTFNLNVLVSALYLFSPVVKVSRSEISYRTSISYMTNIVRKCIGKLLIIPMVESIEQTDAS